MRVVRGVLEMPFQPPRVGIERQHAAGVEIVAFTDRAVKVRREVPHCPVERIGLHVVGPGQPGRAAAKIRRISRPRERLSAGVSGVKFTDTKTHLPRRAG